MTRSIDLRTSVEYDESREGEIHRVGVLVQFCNTRVVLTHRGELQ